MALYTNEINFSFIRILLKVPELNFIDRAWNVRDTIIGSVV
jgi:hypothetical protein